MFSSIEKERGYSRSLARLSRSRMAFVGERLATRVGVTVGRHPRPRPHRTRPPGAAHPVARPRSMLHLAPDLPSRPCNLMVSVETPSTATCEADLRARYATLLPAQDGLGD